MPLGGGRPHPQGPPGGVGHAGGTAPRCHHSETTHSLSPRRYPRNSLTVWFPRYTLHFRCERERFVGLSSGTRAHDLGMMWSRLGESGSFGSHVIGTGCLHRWHSQPSRSYTARLVAVSTANSPRSLARAQARRLALHVSLQYLLVGRSEVNHVRHSAHRPVVHTVVPRVSARRGGLVAFTMSRLVLHPPAPRDVHVGEQNRVRGSLV